MPGKGGEHNKMVTIYTNSTFINLTKLNTPPNVTVSIDITWAAIKAEVQQIFTNFSWLEVAQSLGIFIVFFVLFYNQRFLNLNNSQIIMISSFLTFIWNAFMLYGEYYTSFYMLGTFFLVWLVSLIMTIRDS